MRPILKLAIISQVIACTNVLFSGLSILKTACPHQYAYAKPTCVGIKNGGFTQATVHHCLDPINREAALCNWR